MTHSRCVFGRWNLGGSARYAVVLVMVLLVPLNRTIPASGDTLVDVVDVEPVWAGHPVGFSLLTHPPHQYLAYYDAERQMTVAQRRLDQRTWTLTRLPTHVGWDSHNRVTMAIDGRTATNRPSLSSISATNQSPLPRCAFPPSAGQCAPIR